MDRKVKNRGVRLGLGSIVLALLLIAGMAVYFGARQADVPMSLTPIPAVLILIGFLLIFTDVLETKLDLTDEVENWRELISDDLGELRRMRVTRGIMMLVISIIMIGIEVHLLLYYHKWFAVWFGGINVIGLSLIVSMIAIFIAFRSGWFQWRIDRTPWWVFAIPLIGFVLSGLAGTYYAEPVEFGAPTRIDNLREDTYDWSRTRASTIYIFNSSTTTGSTSSNLDLPECSGKNCGYLYMALILIVVVAICVLGSVFVQHFWVLALTLQSVIMLTIALRELLYLENDGYQRNW